MRKSQNYLQPVREARAQQCILLYCQQNISNKVKNYPRKSCLWDGAEGGLTGAGLGCHSPALDLSVEQSPGDLLMDWGLGHTLSQQFVIT